MIHSLRTAPTFFQPGRSGIISSTLQQQGLHVVLHRAVFLSLKELDFHMQSFSRDLSGTTQLRPTSLLSVSRINWCLISALVQSTNAVWKGQVIGLLLTSVGWLHYLHLKTHGIQSLIDECPAMHCQGYTTHSEEYHSQPLGLYGYRTAVTCSLVSNQRRWPLLCLPSGRHWSD